MHRRVRSAKYSQPLKFKKDMTQAIIVPSVEEKRSEPNENRAETPDEKTSVNIVINSANNSNLGRINLERI